VTVFGSFKKGGWPGEKKSSKKKGTMGQTRPRDGGLQGPGGRGLYNAKHKKKRKLRCNDAKAK